ncbi:conserved hypothetical protein [Frankia sp. AiPs1]|uniref:hypothetical protein n=1 Tax=Frankia sp. AiPa1 TaxID=573492 RepID=UPI00202ADF8A|nr:hypothetical protein [Frankia sp. AiPa1]MCL9757679.1 hypothetical protein [Frankia sp. AiPa1]
MVASRSGRSGNGPRRTPPSAPPAGAGSDSKARGGHAPRTGPPPPPTSRLAQRSLAVLLTVLVFGVVVFGAGAATATFGERWWGYVVGGTFCVVMVIGALRGSRH